MNVGDERRDERKDVSNFCPVNLPPAGVYVLVTSVQGRLMAAVHTTREGAMSAAVDWVEGEAETRLTGTLIERYEEARRFVEGQGGQMEIIISPVWTAVT